MKYRARPTIKEAIQYDGTNLEFILNSFPTFECTLEADLSKGLGIYTLEGKMICNVGDYIVRGIKGEFYPCDSEIFEASYERVSDED